MKRGREDEKIMGPMFPRLHVNDADKGGPRAPPRNKMALYEQLSIPSQRCSNSVVQRNTNNNAARDSIPPSSRGHDSERGMYFSHQVAREHQPSKHYMLYSDMSIPSQQFDLRKKLDEDDYTVPNFIQAGQGQECNKTNNDRHHGRLSSKNISYLNHQLKFGIGKGTEDSSQEGINHPSTECSKNFAGAKTKAVPGSAQKIDVPGSNHSNSIDRSKAGNNLRTDILAESQHSVEVATMVKSNSSNSHEASPSENQNGLHDHINDSESHEDGVCRSLQSKILERGDGVSETSILDSVAGHDITADEVVAIIGQKHFWKARKAIANQQRVFAVQVFELHRLIKVQKLIAASPHLLLEDAACLGKALESLPGKALPLDYSSIKSLPVVSKQKVDLEKTSQRKEVPADSSIAKASLSSAQNGPLPSIGKRLFSLAQNGSDPSGHQTLNGNNIPKTPSLNTEASARPWYLNQQQGHQWLIPVISPSEGLVYEPYPAPGFMNQDCNNYGPPGSIHVMGNFPAPPAYGIPTQPHQYQFPPFPHNYFPYGMPVMSTGAISGSSVDQVNPLSRPNLSNQTNRHTPSNVPNERKEAFQGSSNRPPMDIDGQASTASCPSQRQRSSKVANGSMESRNVLTLFPMSPVKDDSDRIAEVQEKSERPSRVIKVVPHNATSVSESVARIIRSIEEGRQFDSA